jgi:hypothetical protein
MAVISIVLIPSAKAVVVNVGTVKILSGSGLKKLIT